MLSGNRKTYLERKKKNNLYKKELLENPTTNIVNLTHDCKKKECLELWPKRLDHRNYGSIKEIVKNTMTNGIKINNCSRATLCETCIQTKTCDVSYPKYSDNKTSAGTQSSIHRCCGQIKNNHYR